MAAGRIHNFAFFLLTFYFLKLINQFEAILQNKPNLPDTLMNVSPFITKDYENEPPSDSLKTNPIKPNLPEGKIDAKCVFTKDYEEKCG